VPCLLIDALDAPQGWDRATIVHERSLEIFEALGTVDRLLSVGVKTRGARLHSDGEILAELRLDLTASR
jgi:2-polyprenyl-6-methoxyphenol hydroxylase-like FAD-dependent oxidoreductase